ncbi:hypothetical protein CN558_29995, partial [Bacillus wiedmannii]|uniref:acyl carrier protein n=1 Tax=Bacillus wiedmannii TaxID=1890302 RepID=UPI000BFAE20C
YEDEEDRIANSPLLTSSMWENMLRNQGFNQVVILGQDTVDQIIQQHIIIAESNGEIAPNFESRREDMYTERLVSDLSQSKFFLQSSHTNLGSQSQLYSSSIKRTERKNIIQDHIINTLVDVLQVDKKEFDLETPYTDFGIDSILAVRFINQINENLKIDLRSTDLFNYSTIEQLTNYILKNEPYSYVEVNDSREEPQSKGDYIKAIDILCKVESGELETDEAVLLLLMGDEYD